MNMDNKNNGNGIIYVACPGYFKTGGTELCHQLVYKLIQHGVKAIITYINCVNGEYVNPAFEKYVTEYTTIDKIVDENNNIIVIPETETDIIDRFNNIKVYLWWMSVDNFYNGRKLKLQVEERGVIKAVILDIRSRLIKKYRRKKGKSIKRLKGVEMHLAQSEYAYHFLKDNKIPTEKIKILSDYINTEYFLMKNENTTVSKENIIVYNPKKGKRYTRMIMKKGTDMTFIPIINMNNEEVIMQMMKAKIYIDFGPHPGKDRMPREAALLNCCIVTGRRGAAAYKDVDIPEKYKY